MCCLPIFIKTALAEESKEVFSKQKSANGDVEFGPKIRSGRRLNSAIWWSDRASAAAQVPANVYSLLSASPGKLQKPKTALKKKVKAQKK